MTEQIPTFYKELEHKVVIKNIQSNEMLFELPFQLNFQWTNQ